MMTVNVSETALKDIEDALEGMKKKAPMLLKKSVNETARQLLKDVRNDVRKRYYIKVKDVNKEIYIQGKASTGKPSLKIMVSGEQHELKEFDVSPGTYDPKRKKTIKARQLRTGARKELHGGGDKGTPFIIKFKNGHITVAQRDKNGPKSQHGTTLGSRYVKKLLGSSMRSMTKKIWEKNQEIYSSRLEDTVKKHIAELLEG